MQSGQETDFILVSCTGSGIETSRREQVLKAKKVTQLLPLSLSFHRSPFTPPINARRSLPIPNPGQRRKVSSRFMTTSSVKPSHMITSHGYKPIIKINMEDNQK